jgi:hypothetical protein
MSLNHDVVLAMKLGDVLELPGLFMGLDTDTPMLLSLYEARNTGREFRFNLSYMNIRMGTVTATFSPHSVMTLEVT